MKSAIDSLSLGSAAILIAVLSVCIVWLLCSVLPKALRPLWVVIVPFALAYSLYWLPVWLGNDPFEYHVWATLCIGTWFFAGAIPSALLVLILRKRSAK
jgi:Na+-translocating ferredoxin:NAD+ oxidoreductase RnfE subunit